MNLKQISESIEKISDELYTCKWSSSKCIDGFRLKLSQCGPS